MVRRREGCLVIAEEQNPSAYSVPLFPDQALSMVDGHIVFTPYTGVPVSLAEGQRVELGGGTSEIGDTIPSEDGRRASVIPGEGCVIDEYFVVHTGEEM
jgi:hypothetical protein